MHAHRRGRLQGCPSEAVVSLFLPLADMQTQQIRAPLIEVGMHFHQVEPFPFTLAGTARKESNRNHGAATATTAPVVAWFHWYRIRVKNVAMVTLKLSGLE